MFKFLKVGLRINLLTNIYKLFFFFMSLLLVVTNNFVAGESTDNQSSSSQSFNISGNVIKKEERWDRRSNRLMGRPDFLKEIHFSNSYRFDDKRKVPGDFETNYSFSK